MGKFMKKGISFLLAIIIILSMVPIFSVRAKDSNSDRIEGENSVQTSNSNTKKKDTKESSEKTKLIVHFNNTTEKKWDLHIWEKGKDGKKYEFTKKDDFGDVAEIEFEGSVESVGIIVKDDNWNKNPDGDRFVEIKNNPQHIWLRDRDPNIYYKKPARIQDEKVSFSSFNIDKLSELTLKMNKKSDLSYIKNNYKLYINGVLSNDKIKEVLSYNNEKISNTEGLIFKLAEDIDFNSEIVLKAKNSEIEKEQEIKATIGNVVSSKEFDEKFAYKGKLGSIYSKDKTNFKVWAPTAKSVDLLIFEGEKVKEKIPMKKGEKGVYSHELSGDKLGTVYMYDVYFEGKVNRLDIHMRRQLL